MKKFKVGIQLYSIRDAIEKDMDAALKAVKEMGYDYVEFAGYYDHSAEEIRAMLDKYGLRAISVHQGIGLYEEKGQEGVDFVKTLGVKYSGIPWIKKEDFLENWDATIERFRAASELLKKNGIAMMYHNHDFEFANKIDGEYLFYRLYEELPEGVLMPQIDTCWVKYAGVDPVEVIKKYSGRMDTLHLKDLVLKEEQVAGYALIDENGKEIKPEKATKPGYTLVPLGEGIQDWKAILGAAEEAGIEYVIVEQDLFEGYEPLEAVKRSREYLKSLGI